MRQKKKYYKGALARRIVSMTMLLVAVFFILLLSTVVFVYVTGQQRANAQAVSIQSETIVGTFEGFTDELYETTTGMAINTNVTSYLILLSTGFEPYSDPDAEQGIMATLSAVETYMASGLYDYAFVASNSECSSGVDGCLVGTNDRISSILFQIGMQSWFADVNDSETGYVLSEPYHSDISGQTVIAAVSVVKSGLTVLGYVGIEVKLSDITAMMEATVSPDSYPAITMITSGEMLVYVSDGNYEPYRMLSALEMQEMDQTNGFGDAGIASALALDLLDQETPVIEHYLGNRYEVARLSMLGTDYRIVALIDAPIVYGLEITYLALFGIILFLVLMITVILSHKVNKTFRPIGEILLSLDAIKKGDFQRKVQVRENNELRTIADAVNDMSKQIGDQVEIVYKSFRLDQLTGLKNRRANHQEIESTYLVGTDKTAVCLIEVDNFKNINVTKGQNVGDEILVEFAKRLNVTLRQPSHIYANGANEFVFLLPKIKILEAVEAEINRIFEKFREPIQIRSLRIEVKAHIGVAIYPYDGKTMDELIKKCDTALFKAKSSTNLRYVFYNEQITREVTYKAQISEQLAEALNKNQLYLRYQPLVDCRSEIYGFEALVRWSNPTLGEISPQIFVANAEESQLIIPIGTWILKEACEAQVKLAKRFGRQFVMSVNVSPVQLLQKEFLEVLKRIIRETDIDPKFLVLEITENVVIEMTYYLEKTIEYIHEIGARIALDDFGTGYASLTYLRQLPFDNLKIDKSFVDGIFASRKDHSIIGTIVELVHNLNMIVIAEGVETRKQYEFLKQITTDIFQGFLFSKPLLYEELVNYIDQFYKVAKQKRIDVFANKDYID